VILGSDAENARALVAQWAAAKQKDDAFAIEEGTADTWQLGDGPVFRATKSTSTSNSVAYIFRVGTVAAWVDFATKSGLSIDSGAEALRLARMQASRIQSVLAAGPNAASGIVATVTPSVPAATPSPVPEPTLSSTDPVTYCRAGQSPQFTGGFAALHEQVGDSMGQPLECEHADSVSGNTLQGRPPVSPSTTTQAIL
jgi:hypothetical protein